MALTTSQTRPKSLLCLVVLIGSLVLLSNGSTQRASAGNDLMIYTDTLAQGWDNASINATANFDNQGPVYRGLTSISVIYDQAAAIFQLNSGDPISTSQYSELQFWIQVQYTGQRSVTVAVNNDNTHTVVVTGIPSTWVQIDIPLTRLGSPAYLNQVKWINTSGTSQPSYYLDNIALLTGSSGGGGGGGPAPQAANYHLYSPLLAR